MSIAQRYQLHKNNMQSSYCLNQKNEIIKSHALDKNMTYILW